MAQEFVLFLVLLMQWLVTAKTQESESCLLLFTLQPPLSLPCDPYQPFTATDASSSSTSPPSSSTSAPPTPSSSATSSSSSRLLSLQCSIHVENTDRANFTIEWVRIAEGMKGEEGVAEEEVISTMAAQSSPFQVKNSRLVYDSTLSSGSVLVKSILLINFTEEASYPRIPGRYWCRVVAVEEIQREHGHHTVTIGRSSTETIIERNEDYRLKTPRFPPCLSMTPFHQPSIQCVMEGAAAVVVEQGWSMPLKEAELPSGYILLPLRGLVGIVISGGILIVAVLVLILVVVHSCRLASKARENADFNRNRISMQSAETVEEGVEASKRGSNNSLFFLQQQQQQQQNSPRQQSPSQPHPPTPAARPHPLLQSYPSVSLPVQFHQSSFGSRHDSCQLKAGKPMTPPATSGI